MKNSTKGTLVAPKALKAAHSTRLADKGFATAPREVAKIGASQKPGLGTVSAIGVEKAVRNSATPAVVDAARSAQPTALAKPTELDVSIVTGDDGDLYHLFSARGRQIVRPSKIVVEKRSQALGDLSQIGILAVSQVDKKEITKRIEAATENRDIIVATFVGFEKGKTPRYYVFGDGTVITPDEKFNVVPILGSNDRIKSSGELSTFEDRLAKILRDQTVPLTLFFFALTPLVKPFVSGTGYKAENTMIELVGPTSTYKSALACTLAGSLWGNGHSSERYARDWNMSNQKIEELFLELNDHLLVLDEATLADTNDRMRAEKIMNTVHRLSSGQGRARSGLGTHTHSVAMISTSNQPIRQILHTSEDVQRALEVRLISFQLPSSAQSFFDNTPEGFSSVKSAMNDLFEVTSQNYGLLARVFIADILVLVKSDREKITAMIKKSMTKFLSKIGLNHENSDGVIFRRAQTFALIYATAALAFHVGTLKKKRWGRVKHTICHAWNQYGHLQSSAADDLYVAAYMSDPSNTFADARGENKPLISDKKFAQLAGLVCNAKDKALLLCVPSGCKEKLGIPVAALKHLKETGILRSGSKNLLSKRILRCDKTGKKRDAFYVFKINSLPSNIDLGGID